MSAGEKRQYGNFRRPMTAGLGNLNLGTSLTLMGQVMVGFVLFMLSGSLIVGAVVILWLTVFTALTIFPDKHGITPMQYLTERVSFMRRRAKGLTTYQAAIRGDETTPPPGILSTVRLTEHRDGHGRIFALIHYLNGQVAVTLRCHPIGGELHDEETHDRMVASWGGFGAAFANTPGVDQYTAVTEVGPNYGASAIASVEEQMDDEAPELAREINRETTLLGTQSKTSASTYVTVTFSTTAEASRSKDQATRDSLAAADVARRLPGIIQRLKFAGAGSVIPCRAQDIAEEVRVAYDPKMARTVESARVAGNAMHIGWENAGPSFADSPNGKSYIHDSGTSVTFKMTVGPKGTITSDSLRTLIGPHQDIHRKRVTLVRHVIDSGRAADIVEGGFNNARVRAEGPRATASARTDLRIAEAVRNEQAAGAALEDFTVFITVTVLDPNKIDDAVAAIEEQLASSARLTTRIMYGVQDTMFAAALPLGLDLRRHKADTILNKVFG